LDVNAELHGFAAEHAHCSEVCGLPAILATLCATDQLAHAAR
jgi:hypothetical protein